MPSNMIEWDRGERKVLPVMPAPTLAAFAEKGFSVVVPSGAADHWKAVAGWQWDGYATVDVISTGGGPAGLVTLTKAGKKQAGFPADRCEAGMPARPWR